MFDPKYEIAADDGTIHASTQNGLRVSRDGGCTFQTATLHGFGQPDWPDDVWIDALDVAPDGTMWIGTTETGLPNAVYKSARAASTSATPEGVLRCLRGPRFDPVLPGIAILAFSVERRRRVG